MESVHICKFLYCSQYLCINSQFILIDICTDCQNTSNKRLLNCIYQKRDIIRCPNQQKPAVIFDFKKRFGVLLLLSHSTPTKISATAARKISQDAKKNPQASSAELQASLQTSGVSVSRCTIRRYLNQKWAAKCRVARKKLTLYWANTT